MQNKVNKTILIATHQAFTSRFLLQTEILTHLKELGHKIVILSPNADDQTFKDDYLDDNVVIEPFRYKDMEVISNRRLYKFFTQTRSFVLPDHLNITTMHFSARRLKKVNKDKSFKVRFFNSLVLTTACILRKSRLLRDLFVRLESFLLFQSFHQDIFDKHKPDLMMIADLGTIHLSNILLREAKKNRIPIVAAILSWDNLTAKGIGGVKPDYAVAWNNNMKWELENYHDIPSDRIYLGGIPHFDSYFREPFPIDRKRFESTYGVKPGRKVIFFGTSSPTWCKENLDIIQTLCNMAREQQFSEPVQIMIRIHPAYIVSKKENVRKEITTIKDFCSANSDIMIFNEPMMEPRKVGYELPLEDVTNLGGILKHSAVMINQFSTLMLEAAIFDLPMINTGFDNYRKLGIKMSDMRYNTHLRRIVEHGTGTVADTHEEMLKMINLYFEDPSINREARKEICDEEGGPNKGHAGKAIAEYIDSLM